MNEWIRMAWRHHNKSDVSGRVLKSPHQSPLLLHRTVSGCGTRKFDTCTKNNAKRPGFEQLHFLTVDLRASALPQPVVIYLLVLRVFSAPHTPLLSRTFFSPQNTTPGLATTAFDVRQPQSLAACWLLLTRSCDLERSAGSTICNSRRWNSPGVVAPLGRYATHIGSCVRTFQDSISVASSRIFLNCVTVEDGTDRLFRNVGTQLRTRCVTYQKSEDLIQTAAKDWSFGRGLVWIPVYISIHIRTTKLPLQLRWAGHVARMERERVHSGF